MDNSHVFWYWYYLYHCLPEGSCLKTEAYKLLVHEFVDSAIDTARDNKS